MAPEAMFADPARAEAGEGEVELQVPPKGCRQLDHQLRFDGVERSGVGAVHHPSNVGCHALDDAFDQGNPSL